MSAANGPASDFTSPNNKQYLVSTYPETEPDCHPGLPPWHGQGCCCQLCFVKLPISSCYPAAEHAKEDGAGNILELGLGQVM